MIEQVSIDRRLDLMNNYTAPPSNILTPTNRKLTGSPGR